MDRRKLPLILMLIAGLVTVILTYLWNYTIPRKLACVFFVMLIFYLIGSVILWVLNRFEKEIEERQESEKIQDELVIEKDGDRIQEISGEEQS